MPYIRKVQSLDELLEDEQLYGEGWLDCRARFLCVSLEVNVWDVGRGQDLKTVPLQRLELLVCNGRRVYVSFRWVPKQHHVLRPRCTEGDLERGTEV